MPSQEAKRPIGYNVAATSEVIEAEEVAWFWNCKRYAPVLAESTLLVIISIGKHSRKLLPNSSSDTSEPLLNWNLSIFYPFSQSNILQLHGAEFLWPWNIRNHRMYQQTLAIKRQYRITMLPGSQRACLAPVLLCKCIGPNWHGPKWQASIDVAMQPKLHSYRKDQTLELRIPFIVGQIQQRKLVPKPEQKILLLLPWNQHALYRHCSWNIV